MPDLVNLLDHMKGKGVYINGTTYQIDEQGIARGVSDTDAAKLVASRHWMEYDPEAAAKREERRKAIREDFKRERGGIQLIAKDGSVIDPKAEAERAKKAEAAKAKKEPPAEPPVEALTENYPTMSPEEAAPEMPAPPPVDAPTTMDPLSEPPPSKPFEPKPAPEPKEAAPEPEPEAPAEAAPEAAPEESEGDDEWPDPDVTMKKSYLQEMAAAYELQFSQKTTKQELVDMLMEAMYAEPV